MSEPGLNVSGAEIELPTDDYLVKGNWPESRTEPASVNVMTALRRT